MTEPNVDKAPELAKKTISIRLDRRVYDNAVDAATAQGRSFNNWANRVIEYAIAGAPLPRDRIYDRLADPNAYPIVGGEVDTTLGVPNETLNAHADAMEQALGTRPDIVRRGDQEAPLPRPLAEHPERGFKTAKKPAPFLAPAVAKVAGRKRDVDPILKKGAKK